MGIPDETDLRIQELESELESRNLDLRMAKLEIKKWKDRERKLRMDILEMQKILDEAPSEQGKFIIIEGRLFNFDAEVSDVWAVHDDNDTDMDLDLLDVALRDYEGKKIKITIEEVAESQI